ncbi:hypothetical protein CAEBREN_20453 [Caenorhabditis brenneri]|uniref:S-protein homolog n=1 Tax=Caenorhabditis brenneri TaxID=135651 RepID=G0NNB5_CAEBE|nr:hypothetical protein CAEBREN_20453 [Caenorhabditis brenneri]
MIRSHVLLLFFIAIFTLNVTAKMKKMCWDLELLMNNDFTDHTIRRPLVTYHQNSTMYAAKLVCNGHNLINATIEVEFNGIPIGERNHKETWAMCRWQKWFVENLHGHLLELTGVGCYIRPDNETIPNWN